MLDEISRQWHPSIGKAILENWEFSEEMAQAVGEQEDLTRTEPEIAGSRRRHRHRVLMAAHRRRILPRSQAASQGLPARGRLGLNETRHASVMKDSATEVGALSEALGA